MYTLNNLQDNRLNPSKFWNNLLKLWGDRNSSQRNPRVLYSRPSPIKFFINYINNLPSLLKHSKSLLIADDTVIFHSSHSFDNS